MTLEDEKLRKMLDDVKAGKKQLRDLMATFPPLNKRYLDDVLKRRLKPF